MAVDEPEALRVVFTLQLPRDPEESDVRNVTEWIDSLDKKVGLELSSAYRANAIRQHGMLWKAKKASISLAKYLEPIYASKNKGPSVNCRQKNRSKRRGALWVEGRAEGQEYHRM